MAEKYMMINPAFGFGYYSTIQVGSKPIWFWFKVQIHRVERGCITVPAQAARVFLVPAAIFKLSSVSGGSWILKQLMNTNHITISEHGWPNKWLVRSATLINSSRQPLLPQFSNSQAVQESPRNAFIILCWSKSSKCINSLMKPVKDPILYG